MTFPITGPLRTPDEICDLLVAVARHAGGDTRREHLARLATEKGLSSIADFRTVRSLGDDDDERQPEDELPALLVFNGGTAEAPSLDENRFLDFTWVVGFEVAYLGQGKTPRRDALKGMWWYAMAAAQLLVQRTPRGDLIDRISVRDMEPQPLERQTIGVVRVLLEVVTPGMLALTGAPAIPIDELDDPDAPDLPVEWPATSLAEAVVVKAPIPEPATSAGPTHLPVPEDQP